LEVILAGLTPDGQWEPNFSSSPIKNIVPVDNDADPLLGSKVGSVADLIDVDAVEWNDLQKANNSSQSSLSLDRDRRQSVAEQEKNRRKGFAAAYQQRLSSLLWSRDRSDTKSSSGTSNRDEKPEGEGTESLLTSSWRHLTTLPNFLLMPTLGPSRARAIINEEANQEAKREEALSAAQEAVAAEMPSMPSTPISASSVISFSTSSKSSQNSLKNANDGIKEHTTSGPKGRGVMTPLQADSDVSAYVPGLGLPIDPDLELSSVVHLQTFRTTHPSQSRSRRGSLEKPTSVDVGIHRRSYSDNSLEPPSIGFNLENRRSDVGRWNPFATRVSNVIEPVVVEGRKPLREDVEEKRGRSPRACSRPAVQAPVPGNYSAYHSSGSEEEENTKGDVEGRQDSRGRAGRGRKTRSRMRSSSPPSSRQHAIGLFDSKAHGRTGQEKDVVGTEDGASHVLRVRSTPNLASMATRHNRQRQARHSGGRGRAGSVKVVSASFSKENESIKGDVQVDVSAQSATRVPYPSRVASPSPSPNRSSLGMGVPSQVASRPSMVSNGAHLLMLSLELEMMRNRKITCSLKPRWLKARIRSESSVRTSTPAEMEEEGGGDGSGLRPIMYLPSRPRLGSSLRFEVVPHQEESVVGGV